MMMMMTATPDTKSGAGQSASSEGTMLQHGFRCDNEKRPWK